MPPGGSADPGLPRPHDHQRMAHQPRKLAASNASNPCSEYMFLDNTACNSASLNSAQIRQSSKLGDVDIEAYRHAVRLWTIVLKVSVLMAQFLSREIARLSVPVPYPSDSAMPISAQS